MAIHSIYRFYAELEGYKPKIWRRFEVNGNKTIAELGYIVMTLFEMEANHLFRFTDNHLAEHLAAKKKCYSDEALRKLLGVQEYENLMALRSICYELPFYDNDEEGDTEFCDARNYRLNKVIGAPPRALIFEYDYGDGWRVTMTLESIEKVEMHANELPRVLEGEGFGVVEDCGGVGGLKEIEKAFKKKKGRQYKGYVEWLGCDDFNMELFDVDDINFRLKKLPRIYKNCYENSRAPSQRAIDLIERSYQK